MRITTAAIIGVLSVSSFARAQGPEQGSRLAPIYSGNTTHWEILGTASVGIFAPNYGFTAGARLGVDYYRFTALIESDFFSSTAGTSGPNGAGVTVNAAEKINVLVGGNIFAQNAIRWRILGGVSVPIVLLPTQSAGVSGRVGTSFRLGGGVFGLDAATFLSFYPYWEFEARAALAIRLLFVQVHLGWRFVAFDPKSNDTFDGFLKAPNSHGPYFALGFGW